MILTPKESLEELLAKEIFLDCWDGSRETGLQAWEERVEVDQEPYRKDARKYINLVVSRLASLSRDRDKIVGIICPCAPVSPNCDTCSYYDGENNYCKDPKVDQILAIMEARVQEAVKQERGKPVESSIPLIMKCKNPPRPKKRIKLARKVILVHHE